MMHNLLCPIPDGVTARRPKITPMGWVGPRIVGTVLRIDHSTRRAQGGAITNRDLY